MKRTYSHAMRKYLSAAIVSAGVMTVFAIVTVFFELNKYVAAGIEIALAVLIAVYVAVLSKSRKKMIVRYLNNITGNEEGLSENVITSVPLPMAVCSVDGTIRWYNERFSTVFDGKRFEHESLDDCIKSLKWTDVLKFPNGKRDVTEHIGDKTYSVKWCILKDNMEPNRIGEHYSVFFYLNDITEVRRLREHYENERVDIVAINIDNIDEFIQKVDDDTAETTSSKIRNCITAWAKMSDAVLKKLDRDKYFAAFEHQNLQKYIDDNFSIIDNIVKIAEEVNFPLSLSIGIGTGGSLAENEESARHALDLALGRGGGQVCIKYDTEFKFYGGRNVEYERSTRVKARSVATALGDFIKNSDRVIFMGHKTADYDCFGAAVGLQRAVRSLGAVPYIVHERVSPAVEHMYSELKNVDEYKGMFLDENEAADKVTPNTLVVVLDTHRPSMVPSPKLLEKAEKIVVIDHHRRSTEFISPCSLVYHEPYASSTCEMVTELLEYINIDNAITRIEAQCLYTGILMDTKNFMLKTGVRTFEAASYLRRQGLDTVAVRRMFSSSLEEYTQKSEIVGRSRMVTDEIAISTAYSTHPNMRVIASQAADEMLNLQKVKASVVVFPADGGVGVSSRSLGTVNVQLIMEKLGGGGHMTVAGATINARSVDEGVEMAVRAIKEYNEEIRKCK